MRPIPRLVSLLSYLDEAADYKYQARDFKCHRIL